MTRPQALILMATIGAAQGLKGEVRVNSHASDPLKLIDYNFFVDSSGARFEIERGRAHKNVLIAKFKGIDDRTVAEKLNGTQLFVGRSVLDRVIEEDDEFLYADLVGLKVRDETGHDWGKIVAVFDFGAGDILEIKGLDGKLRMIPFSKAAAPVVDIAGGNVQIDVAASGIRDEAPDKQDLGGGEA